jgi:hypothetical protein
MLKKNKNNIKEVEEMSKETTDEALKASLEVKGKSSNISSCKAKGKMGMAVSK